MEGEYPGISRPNWAKNGIQFAEEYLVTQDLMNRQVLPNYTLLQSLQILRENYIVIDEGILDLVWDKNSKRELANRSRFQGNELYLSPMRAWEWQKLNCNLDEFYLEARNQLESFLRSDSEL